MVTFAILSLPITQSFIAKKTVHWLNQNYDIDINIERIYLKPNGKVSLKEVLINDFRKNAMISAKNLQTSILFFKELIEGNLYFGVIEADSLVFNLRTYKGDSLSNLNVFIESFRSDSPSQEPFILQASKVNLTDCFFRIIDDNNPTATTFELEHINTNVKDFKVIDSEVRLNVINGHFLMDKKLQFNHLSTIFSFTDSLISAENSVIKTAKSELYGDVFLFPKNGSMGDFLNNVTLSVTLPKATIATDDLNAFYNQFAYDKSLLVSDFSMKGTLNNFSIKKIIAKHQHTLIDGKFRFRNLFKDKEKPEIHGDLHHFTSLYSDLAYLMPTLLGENLPREMQQLGVFSSQGSFSYEGITLNTNLDFNFKNGSGHITGFIDFLENTDQSQYHAQIHTHNFPIGIFLEEKNIGNITADLSVSGTGFSGKSAKLYAKGDLHSLSFNGYPYKNIHFDGEFKNQVLGGKVISNDPNFKLKINALADLSQKKWKLNLDSDINHIDFHQLHLLNIDSISQFKGKIAVNIEGKTIDDWIGNILLKQSQYTNSKEIFTFGNINVVASEAENQSRNIRISSSDVISGNISGFFKVAETKKIFQNAIGSLYQHYKPYQITQGQYIDFDLKIKNKIARVFIPELSLSDSTTVKGSVVANQGDFKLQFKTPKISAFDYTFNKVNLTIDNKNPLFKTLFYIDKVDLDIYPIQEFHLISNIVKDTLFFRTNFNGGQHNEDKYDLSFYHTFNQKQESVIGIKKSELKFKGNQWFLNREETYDDNKIIVNRTADTIKVDNLRMSHQKQYLSLNGIFSSDDYKNLHMVANNVSLEKVIPSINGLDVHGTINGHLSLLQRGNMYYPSSDIFIRYLRLNGYDYGDLEVNAFGNNDLSAFKVHVHFINGKTPGFELLGNVFLDKKQGMLLDFDAHFGNFNLKPFNPFLEGILYDLRGTLSGDIKISGSAKKPIMKGKLNLSNGGFGIDYLKVNTSLQPNAEIIINNQTFEFKNWTLTDTEFKTQATLNGNIRHNSLSDWFIDLSLDTQNKRFLVLNTPYTNDALFYGVGFINGKASISGAIEELVIDVEAKTSEGTKFKIPLNDSESIADDSFISFTEKRQKHIQVERTLESVKGLEMNFELTVLPSAEVEIIIDPKVGGNLIGRGEGTLLLEINTNGKFNMWGDFIANSGFYNFKYENIIDKRFTVLQGGSISWNGDPLKATLRNLQASYNLNANPAILLESSQYNRKIATQVVIKLEGELMKPELLFDINFPDSNPGLVAELNYRLEDQDRKQLQALSLLAQGSFISEKNTDNRIVAYNLFETAAGLFNSILSDDDNKLNLGVSYEASNINNSTNDLDNSDRLGFTVSTQINDWVNINAKVGIPVGGVTRTAVAGDVEVQLRLTEDGSLTAKIFNRENEMQQYLAEQIGYAQGVGIAYTVDFNTFKELIHKILGKKGTIIEPAKNN